MQLPSVQADDLCCPQTSKCICDGSSDCQLEMCSGVAIAVCQANADAGCTWLDTDRYLRCCDNTDSPTFAPTASVDMCYRGQTKDEQPCVAGFDVCLAFAISTTFAASHILRKLPGLRAIL